METLKTGSDALFILLGAIMVLAMHAGFAFLELGTVRKKNQVNALVKILVDFAVSTIAYFFIGYSIAYGVKHPFNGNIYSKSVGLAITGFLGIDEGYILKLENVPAKNCFSMASAFASTALQISVDAPATAPVSAAITTGVGVAETAVGGGTAVIVKPAGSTLSAANLALQCTANPSVVKNIYLWFAY